MDRTASAAASTSCGQTHATLAVAERTMTQMHHATASVWSGSAWKRCDSATKSGDAATKRLAPVAAITLPAESHATERYTSRSMAICVRTTLAGGSFAGFRLGGCGFLFLCQGCFFGRLEQPFGDFFGWGGCFYFWLDLRQGLFSRESFFSSRFEQPGRDFFSRCRFDDLFDWFFSGNFRLSGLGGLLNHPFRRLFGAFFGR